MVQAAMKADQFLLHLAKLPRSPETLKSYECKVRSAMKVCECNAVASMVSAPEKSFRCLETHYTVKSTLKQTLTAILATIGAHKKWCQSNEATRLKWRGYHSSLSKSLHAPGAKEITTKIMAKYVCWKDILAAARRACSNPSAHLTLADSLECVLLSLVTNVPPKRSDYGEMALVSDKRAACRGNCIVLRQRPQMIIADYKTSKSYGQLVENLPKQFVDVLTKSLAAWPRDYLFVIQKTMGPLSPDGFGSFVKRTMKKHVGKPVGVTMLRHIFVSDVVAKLDKEGKAEMARRMLHSTAEQAGYVITQPNGKPIC